MKEIQTIRTASGEELVVLPKAEYEALVAAAVTEDDEDTADIMMYDQRKAALLAGKDHVLPDEVGRLILTGDTLFKALRTWRGLTQQELSLRTGLSQGFLSGIERGTKACAGETLIAIAKALNVPEDWLRPV